MRRDWLCITKGNGVCVCCKCDWISQFIHTDQVLKKIYCFVYDLRCGLEVRYWVGQDSMQQSSYEWVNSYTSVVQPIDV